MAARPSSPKLNAGTRGLLPTRRPHVRGRREQLCQSEKGLCGTLLSSGSGHGQSAVSSRFVFGRPPRLGVHHRVRRGEAYFSGCEGATRETSEARPGQRQLLQRRRCSRPFGASEKLAKELAREGFARRREFQRRRQSGIPQGKPRQEDQEVRPLESKHRKGKSRGGKEEKLLQKLAGSSDSNPLQALATVELLKKFRGKTKKKSRGSSSSSASARSSRSSSLESRRGHKATGVAKAVSIFRSWKRGLRRHPLRHVRRYVKQVEHDLGATDGAPYRLTDHGKRLAWNRQKSLQRVYDLLGAILEKQLRGHPDQAAMLTVQSLRAVHQVVIDEGNRSVAWLLTGLEDPFARRRFGGEEESLETIAAFLKASQDLERRRKSWNLGSDNGQAQPPESAEVDTKGKGPKGGKGRGRNQDPAKADA